MAVVLACNAAGVFAQDVCPYLPAFKALRGQLDNMSALDAAKALQAYASNNDNPENCEYMELDRALAARERKLVKLVSGGRDTPAHAVFRCNEFNPKTAQCQSPLEDGTAQLGESGVTPAAAPKPGASYDIISLLPSATLHAVYRTSLSDALNGRAAKKVGIHSRGKWYSMPPSTVLIAIYKTKAIKGPWAYRKVVWYF
jgi:hypothetical protein